MWTLSENEKAVVEGILRKTVAELNPKTVWMLALKEDVWGVLSLEEKKLWKKLEGVDPKANGFAGPWVGLFDVPKDLVKIEGEDYKGEDGLVELAQYLPNKVYGAYQKMGRALKKETGSTLIVSSGYRSGTYQVLLFWHYLKVNGYDFAKTVKRVAMPGYSEHGDPVNTGVDMVIQERLGLDDNLETFSNSMEYKWLTKKANQFGFKLSYPKDNEVGMMFEPWHWRYEG